MRRVVHRLSHQSHALSVHSANTCRLLKARVSGWETIGVVDEVRRCCYAIPNTLWAVAQAAARGHLGDRQTRLVAVAKCHQSTRPCDIVSRMNGSRFARATTQRALSNDHIAQCSDMLSHPPHVGASGQTDDRSRLAAHALAFAGTIALVRRPGSAIPTVAPKNERPAEISMIWGGI